MKFLRDFYDKDTYFLESIWFIIVNVWDYLFKENSTPAMIGYLIIIIIMLLFPIVGIFYLVWNL